MRSKSIRHDVESFFGITQFQYAISGFKDIRHQNSLEIAKDFGHLALGALELGSNFAGVGAVGEDTVKGSLEIAGRDVETGSLLKRAFDFVGLERSSTDPVAKSITAKLFKRKPIRSVGDFLNDSQADDADDMYDRMSEDYMTLLTNKAKEVMRNHEMMDLVTFYHIVVNDFKSIPGEISQLDNRVSEYATQESTLQEQSAVLNFLRRHLEETPEVRNHIKAQRRAVLRTAIPTYVIASVRQKGVANTISDARSISEWYAANNIVRGGSRESERGRNTLVITIDLRKKFLRLSGTN